MEQEKVRPKQPPARSVAGNEANVETAGHTHRVAIYVSAYCVTCDYATEIAGLIRAEYPHILVRIIDLAAPQEPAPDIVFATPTYLLDGRLWSLGNPSPSQVRDTLNRIDYGDRS